MVSIGLIGARLTPQTLKPPPGSMGAYLRTIGVLGVWGGSPVEGAPFHTIMAGLLLRPQSLALIPLPVSPTVTVQAEKRPGKKRERNK